MILRLYYHCYCINEPVIFIILGHQFHALLKVCSDHDDIVPLIPKYFVLFYPIKHCHFGIVIDRVKSGNKATSSLHTCTTECPGTSPTHCYYYYFYYGGGGGVSDGQSGSHKHNKNF